MRFGQKSLAHFEASVSPVRKVHKAGGEHGVRWCPFRALHPVPGAQPPATTPSRPDCGRAGMPRLCGHNISCSHRSWSESQPLLRIGTWNNDPASSLLGDFAGRAKYAERLKIPD